LQLNHNKALKIALERKESELRKIKKSGEAIVDKINNEIATNQGTNIPTLKIVQGRANIYSDIGQLIESSTNTVYIATTLEDISKMYHSIIPEKIKICEKNGGKVLLLVEIDDMEMISFVKRFGATETRICKLPSKGRIVVQKAKQMIMSDSNQTASNSETDFSLSTIASPDFLIFLSSDSFLSSAIFSACCGSTAIHSFGLDKVVEIIFRSTNLSTVLYILALSILRSLANALAVIGPVLKRLK